ncbi:fatty acid-binding protein, liver-like [Bradysia coprophila]|uniref:fatty acid-binding protein, liver-like n=1 Tax=Bradysia coprophila TaxID=38358 RepID=UPI00187D8801|nr:fatty acid-binding protein, liver-like [Bradysia coprophila]
MEKCLNKSYKLVRFDEFYDDYLEAIGLNIFNRKIAKSIPSTTQFIKLDDCAYAINTIIPFKTHQQKFVLGQENDAFTIDGRKIKNLFVIDGNKLIEQQIEPVRKVTITREFTDDEILGEIVVGDVICKYWCSAVQ